MCDSGVINNEIVQVTLSVTLFVYNDDCSDFEITEYSKRLDLNKNYHLETMSDLLIKLDNFYFKVLDNFVNLELINFIETTKCILLNDVVVFQRSIVNNHVEFAKRRSAFI